MGLLRGVFVGTLSLVALRAVTSSDLAAGRAGGVLVGASRVLDIVINPATPALPDLRQSAGVASSVAASFTRNAPTPTTSSGGGETAAPSAPNASGANPAVAGVIAEAKKHLGTPYKWGGKKPGGFDCSGLLGYAYRHGADEEITSWTGTQVNQGKKVASMADALPGDLLFYGSKPVPRHVVMYLGGGQRIHAPQTGDVVKIDSAIGKPSYIRRILPAKKPAATAPRIPRTVSV